MVEVILTQAALREQIAHDKAQWEALSPTVRRALENELAAIWPSAIARSALSNEGEG